MIFLGFAGDLVRLLVAFEVAKEAVGFAFEQSWTLASTGAGNGFLGGFLDGENIVPVYSDTRHIIGGGAVGNVFNAAMVMGWSGFCIAVVLGDKDNRQFPDGGQVEALVERALLRGPIAKEANRDLISLVCLGRQTRTTSERRTTTNNAIGTQHALIQIGNMH